MNKDLILKAAQVAHETNRVWCEVNGDFSQPKWADAPAWQKESAVNGMIFHSQNPDADDSASHDSWSKEKIDNGWEWGEVKDPNSNPPTHPCLVPFEELPIEQQIKDGLFRSIAHQILLKEDTA